MITVEHVSIDRPSQLVAGWISSWLTDWEQTCEACGIRHRWMQPGVTVTDGRMEVVTYWCNSCEEDHEENRWYCERCAERLYPAQRSHEEVIRIPGLPTFEITFTSTERLEMGAEVLYGGRTYSVIEILTEDRMNPSERYRAIS